MKVRIALRIALLNFVAAWGAWAQGPQIDWKAQQAETLDRYRALVQIDSSGPAGNETKVAAYLKGVFAEAGIPTQLFAQEPARANLVARIPGNGKKRPVLLLAHTDVVAYSARSGRWIHSPL